MMWMDACVDRSRVAACLPKASNRSTPRPRPVPQRSMYAVTAFMSCAVLRLLGPFRPPTFCFLLRRRRHRFVPRLIPLIPHHTQLLNSLALPSASKGGLKTNAARPGRPAQTCLCPIDPHAPARTVWIVARGPAVCLCGSARGGQAMPVVEGFDSKRGNNNIADAVVLWSWAIKRKPTGRQRGRFLID